MKLGDKVELVIATVLDDHDPKKLGRIKVGAPGVFDRTTMSIDSIPWVYPFTMCHMQSFTHMQAGSKVWLIMNKENQEEFWWIPYHELYDDTKAAINDDVESDVLFSRNIQGKIVQIYHNKEEGLVIKNGTALIELNNNGQIVGHVVGQGGDEGCFKVEGNNFYCGKNMGGVGDWYKMVKGDVLYDMLERLVAYFGMLAVMSERNNTSTLVDPFRKCAEAITEALNRLLSERAFVSP